jgi:hypothetical protein
LGDELGQARLEERAGAQPELPDLLLVLVQADHVVAERGKCCGGE